MSIGLQIEAPELRLLQDRLLRISQSDFSIMLDGLGGIVESQTHRRIRQEKSDPQGNAWIQWSDKYAGSKHGASKSHQPHPGELTSSQGHTLLFLDGHLDDSIQHLVRFDEVEIGSNLKYARRQNTSRQFIGLSEENTAEALEVVEDFLSGIIGPLK